MLDFLLLCIVFSCCCFICFGILLFVFFFFLIFGYPSKNVSQKIGHSENPKHETYRKKRIFRKEQFAQVCSQLVCFFFWCVFKFGFFPENTIESWLQPKNKKHKQTTNACAKNCSKCKLNIGPSMLRNKVGPVFNTSFFVFVF